MGQFYYGDGGIDDACYRRIDDNADGDYTDSTDSHWYLLRDIQGNVVAVVDETGSIHERVHYDPWGQARHSWAEDFDGDGDVDATDGAYYTALTLPVSITAAGYNADLDLDMDGDVDSTDQSLFNAAGYKAALAVGAVSDRSGPDNPFGYASYLHRPETGHYLARNRHYDPVEGRWISRDPIGYADGFNLYEYVGSGSTRYTDPSGLSYISDLIDGGRELIDMISGKNAKDDAAWAASCMKMETAQLNKVGTQEKNGEISQERAKCLRNSIGGKCNATITDVALIRANELVATLETTKDIVTTVIPTGIVTSLARKIVSVTRAVKSGKIVDYVYDTFGSYAGRYNTATKRISVNLAHAGEESISQTLRHEAVHAVLDTTTNGMRSNLGQWFYTNSKIMRRTEEFIAQFVATGSIRNAWRHMHHY